LLARHRSGGLQCRGLALLLVAMAAALAMAVGTPALASSSGPVVAWGENGSGQLGDGSTKNTDTPVGVTGLNGVTAISAGGNFSVALLSNGTVMQSGANGSYVPVAVSGLSGVTAISAGGIFSLALLSNGTVMKWTGSGAPVTVSGLSGVVAVASGLGFGEALLSNGTVMAWGNNEYGELGNGTTESSEVPVAVKELTGVTAISAGYFHSLALLSSGQVMAWGNDFDGQLGDGIVGEQDYEHQWSDVPVAVCAVGSLGPCPTGPYLAKVTAVSAHNAMHSVALLDDGTAVAWGHNDAGQLGNGTTTTTGVPGAVSGLSGVTALAAGFDHSLALLSNHTAMAWGYNAFGQLGDGTRTGPEKCDVAQGGGGFPCSTIPVAVSGLSGLIGVSAGSEHSLAFHSPTPPTVTKVGPKKGPVTGGTTVTVTGTSLTAASTVKFGSTNASSFTVKSDTSITATAPPSAVGTVDVTVTTLVGTSAISSADQFKFVPAVRGLNPNSGSSAGGTSVTVTGAGFALGTTATTFKFGTRKATSVNCTSTTTCTIISPAHPAGTVHVKATVNKMSSANSPADQFTYN
jgi:alpha-tubulin suppressor-like RCC1 family protein